MRAAPAGSRRLERSVNALHLIEADGILKIESLPSSPT